MVKVELKFLPDGRPVLTAMVAWVEKCTNADVTFIVDTGSNATFLGQGDAEKLGAVFNDLDHHNAAFGGVGGTGQARLLKEVMIMVPCGPGKAMQVSIKKMKVLKNPESIEKADKIHLNNVVKRLDAPSLIGVDFLGSEGLDLFVDVKNRKGYLQSH
jgi:hypothetical protein